MSIKHNRNHEAAIEAACRSMHQALGVGNADDLRHSPYQSSWEPPDSVQWKKWIETCEEAISAYLAYADVGHRKVLERLMDAAITAGLDRQCDAFQAALDHLEGKPVRPARSEL